LANLALFGLAFAEDTTSDQEITGVSLYFKRMPATANFDSIDASTGQQTNDKDFASAITIAGATTVESGIEVTVKATPFYRTSDYAASFAAVSNFQWQTDDDGTLETTGTARGVDCNQFDDTTGHTELDDSTGGDGTTTDQTSDLKLVDDATTGDVNFECDMTPQMRLVIPAGQASGTYRSTTTFMITDA